MPFSFRYVRNSQATALMSIRNIRRAASHSLSTRSIVPQTRTARRMMSSPDSSESIKTLEAPIRDIHDSRTPGPSDSGVWIRNKSLQNLRHFAGGDQVCKFAASERNAGR